MLYPAFEKKLNEFLAIAKASKMSVGVHCGYRSFKEQDALFNKLVNGKRVTKARGGLSWHNYGVAARMIFEHINEIEDREEIKKYLTDLESKGFLTKEVKKEVNRLFALKKKRLGQKTSYNMIQGGYRLPERMAA